MLVAGVVIEIVALLLQALPAYVANVALVLFVRLQIVCLLPQRAESVQHETAHDVSE